MISRLDLVNDFLSIFVIFFSFPDPLLGKVFGQICENMEYGKRVKNRVEKESTVNEVCGRGGARRRGGRLHLRALQVGATK